MIEKLCWILSKYSSTWQNGCVLACAASLLTQWSSGEGRRNASVRILWGLAIDTRHHGRAVLYPIKITVTPGLQRAVEAAAHAGVYAVDPLGGPVRLGRSTPPEMTTNLRLGGL